MPARMVFGALPQGSRNVRNAQSADPPARKQVSNVGMLGQGWDGIPRENRFPGTVGYQPPAAAFRSVGQALAVTPYGDSPHEVPSYLDL